MSCALSATLMLGITGCVSGGVDTSGLADSSREATSTTGGYLPSEITNISGGGTFDTSSLTPRDSEQMPLTKLEGYWEYEGLAESELSETSDSDAYVVTDKTITINDQKIECLPKTLDIRPYSPVKALITQGFGYGAAVFEEKYEDDDIGIHMIGTIASMPYAGNGFICAISGNTLALGFLDPNAEIDEYGTVTDMEDKALDECTLAEVDYEVSLDGDRLTLSYDGVSASYVQESSAPLMSTLHTGLLFGERLYEGDSLISILGYTARGLLGQGFDLDYDLDELLPTCSVSEEFTIKTPGGATLSAKLVNPYEKSVPAGFCEICWYEYDGNKAGGLTVGMPSTYEGLHTTQEFGITPYADVYNNYSLPYESSKDSLSYKGSYAGRILRITPLGDGYDTGDKVLETERSCDIRFGFDDNVLASLSVGDPAYLSAGLQDNIARDDLDELKPSVYREVTERRDEILDELKKSFKEAGLDAAINEKTGEVVMDNNVLFAVDSYDLGSEGKAYLDKVFLAYASVVLDDKYADSLKEVSFEGNTDSDGESEYNMRLSENRANTVMGYCASLLDSKQKAAFDKLAVSKGYGESDLVYNEEGHEDKAASRRVAIKFMMRVDDHAASAEPSSGDEDSNSTSASKSSPASSSAKSDSSDEQDTSGDLEGFRSISDNFDQAWSFYEGSEGKNDAHVAILLLSKDHDYCAYLDAQQIDEESARVSYTFGRTDVRREGENNQTITVHHRDDNDKLAMVFGAWGSDDTVSLVDPWGNTTNLAASDNVDGYVSYFEEVIAP